MRKVEGRLVRDTLDELVAPDVTAVLAIDIQNDFCADGGHFHRYGKDLSRIQATLPTMVRFIQEAQELGIPVVFVRQFTLPDGKSDSPAWLRFKTRDGKSPDYCLPGSWGWQFVDGLVPGKRDTVVEKPRPDGFVRTNLDGVLRAQGIETVVCLGTTTEGCVESTIRGASYHDYYTVVVGDAVATTTAARHEGSMGLLGARYPVHSAEEILCSWRRAKGAARAA
ncbi:MAG: cysteine hydrolase [Hyphomicrobiaceae bacterium]|nr:cysteine hydrolase [Hyphomicrobiaceae bacterium]